MMNHKAILLAGLVLLGAVPFAWAQFQPWAVQWLNHASSAANGRSYLGVTNAAGMTTNLLVLTPTGTNTLCYTNGVLRRIQ